MYKESETPGPSWPDAQSVPTTLHCAPEGSAGGDHTRRLQRPDLDPEHCSDSWEERDMVRQCRPARSISGD